MEENKQRKGGRWKLFAVIAVCASPMIASYLTYYVIKPEGRTNYGALIDPRAHPMPELGTVTLARTPVSLDSFKGKWLMLQVADAECQQDCRKRLHDMRQLRLAQGKEMERIERVWLVTDNKPLETTLMREYDGMQILRVQPDKLKAWLPAESNTMLADHIYMIDPLGNLMMRFPKDADPNKIKKDLGKLLKASRIG
ncbi:SCO family protein [Noviherbaspirillum saxi]|uniref:Cytochrome C oxidase subunit I n=1 Tax=Noviherbaspirillum saxi TaxID=2320863 RepID=A0A3A3FTX4_9BURK|nr:cytochrome C oxidase subunit I [Noviherbaspirillum saxi]RJF97631.1 cytochrome C oxidase subunit I [Noviherbaspirillum saxi]